MLEQYLYYSHFNGYRDHTQSKNYKCQTTKQNLQLMETKGSEHQKNKKSNDAIGSELGTQREEQQTTLQDALETGTHRGRESLGDQGKHERYQGTNKQKMAGWARTQPRESPRTESNGEVLLLPYVKLAGRKSSQCNSNV